MDNIDVCFAVRDESRERPVRLEPQVLTGLDGEGLLLEGEVVSGCEIDGVLVAHGSRFPFVVCRTV